MVLLWAALVPDGIDWAFCPLTAGCWGATMNFTPQETCLLGAHSCGEPPRCLQPLGKQQLRGSGRIFITAHLSMSRRHCPLCSEEHGPHVVEPINLLGLGFAQRPFWDKCKLNYMVRWESLMKRYLYETRCIPLWQYWKWTRCDMMEKQQFFLLYFQSVELHTLEREREVNLAIWAKIYLFYLFEINLYCFLSLLL